MKWPPRAIRAMTAVLIVIPGCDAGTDNPVSDDRIEQAANQLCPVMWEWVKSVGASFNEASSDVATILPAEDRAARWQMALDEMSFLIENLATDVGEMGEDDILAPIVQEILRDVPKAEAEIDDLRVLIAGTPEVDEMRHQERSQQLIIRVEKVISLPKPDMASLDPTGELIPVFRHVPSCQHALNDVDDGRPQANG